MKYLPLILMFAIFGCGRTGSPSEDLNQQILEWVPAGTPLSSARQILEQHQFTCTVVSYTNMEAMVRDHQDAFPFTTGVLRDGKIQAVTNVSILHFKSQKAEGRLTSVNSQFTGDLIVMTH